MSPVQHYKVYIGLQLRVYVLKIHHVLNQNLYMGLSIIETRILRKRIHHLKLIGNKNMCLHKNKTLRNPSTKCFISVQSCILYTSKSRIATNNPERTNSSSGDRVKLDFASSAENKAYCVWFVVCKIMFCGCQKDGYFLVLATTCYLKVKQCARVRVVSMSVRTRLLQRVYTQLSFSLLACTQSCNLPFKNSRQEWLREHSSNILPSSARTASIYCGRTTILADDQLLQQRYHLFAFLKRIGPCGVLGSGTGPRYRHAAGLTQVSIVVKSAGKEYLYCELGFGHFCIYRSEVFSLTLKEK